MDGLSDLSAAAKRLRASVAALYPPHQSRWRATRQDVRTAEGFEIVGIGTAPVDEEAAHIALTASPDVVTAVADLLDAVALHVEAIHAPVPYGDADLARSMERGRDALRDVRRRSDDLADLINREA